MSGESLQDNEVADSAVAQTQKINADSATSNEDKSMSGAQLGNNFVMSVEFEDEKDEETNRNETGGEKTLTDNNDGEHTALSDLYGDYMVKLHQNTSEDEEDEDDDLWEEHDDDSEEDDEETAIAQNEASEEEETDGEDDEEDFEGDDEEIAHAEDEVSKKDAIEEEKKKENVEVEKVIASKDEKKAEEHNVGKVEAKVNKSKGKREKNEVREESLKRPNTTENSKSSAKRKGKKRVESMGMIFMCSSNTKNDCFKYMVLGQSESKKDLVEKIYPGMRLFLYDVDLRLMYGIFKARERGGYNIEPKAFKSKFPSQVRFTILADCLPLPEERFKKVMKENYFTKKKFNCQLNSEQVKKLCKLFKSTSKGQLPKKLPRSRKLEKRPIPTRQERSRKRRGEDERKLPERKEIRYIERPLKRPRKALSPVARSRHPLPAPSTVSLTALDRNLGYELYRQDPYFESRSRDPYFQDPSESRRDRPIERERRDPYLERSREPYPDGRDLYLDRRYPYRDVRDPRLDHRAPCTDTRDSYSDSRIHYRDGLDQYPDSRDLYRDDRGAYIERRVYINDPYGRNPLPERRDVYREDRAEDVYRDSYRSQGVLDQPLSLESRRRYEVESQDSYAPYRALSSNAEPFYSSQYPSRTYRL